MKLILIFLVILILLELKKNAHFYNDLFKRFLYYFLRCTVAVWLRRLGSKLVTH